MKVVVNKISWDSVSHAIKKNINFARNVTRTKMTYWENRGRQTVYTALNKMGIDGGKIWVTMDDSRVREAHAEMDGVRVPLEDPFICEGYEMMYPGDMSGGAPASLTYNCRCKMQREKSK